MNKYTPWYTENEVTNCLKNMHYSDEIAKELASLYTKHLNSAYRKGLEHGFRQYNPSNIPLPKSDNYISESRNNDSDLIKQIKICKDEVIYDMDMNGYPMEAPLIESLVSLIKLIEKL